MMRNIILLLILIIPIYAVPPREISNEQEQPLIVCDQASEDTIRRRENNILGNHTALSHYLQQSAQEDFFRAAAQGDLRTLRARLQGDRDVDPINVNLTYGKHKHTALMYAAFYGNIDIVKELLSVPEIWINRADDQGYTALDIAVKQKHTDIADMIRTAVQFREKILR